MAHIKKLVMHGFKSFASKTELPFDKGINVIIGPNGSGKSNISDALCFVLGRLSIKSMRAAKAANMIFQGTKERKPAQEASVELVFDNSDRAFSIDKDEIILHRIVRRKGTSIYKINNEIKTRQEVLELLSQAGIDPHGFNIVLQGEISRFVKMHSEQRREIIEEVAGISIYESRKQRSLYEIEKTEQKLKEVGAVLRERTAYLRNLEEERKQALKFKQLEKIIKECKAGILKRNADEKFKELEKIEKDIEKTKKYKEAIIKEIEEVNSKIQEIEEKINEINNYIQKTTGFERESLNEEITMLNSKIAADRIRKENFEKKISENETRKKELESNLKEIENELNELKNKSPKVSRRQEEIQKKRHELEEVEDEKEKLYSIETELNALKERIRDKENLAEKANTESKLLFSQINSLSEDISSRTFSECESKIKNLKMQIEDTSKQINNLSGKGIEIEKRISIANERIKRNTSLKEKMPSSEKCPLCQTKLTPEHIKEVVEKADKIIRMLNSETEKLNSSSSVINSKKKDLEKSLELIEKTFSEKQVELAKLSSIEEKKSQMKKFMEEEKEIRKEIERLGYTQKKLEEKIQEKEIIEERYEKLFFEIQEVSSRTDENINTTILYKERELENIQSVIKNILKDKNEILRELDRISGELNSNSKKLLERQKASQILNEKFRKKFDERTKLQEQIKHENTFLINKQNAVTGIESSINNMRVEIARISAERESFEFELKEFLNVQFISGSLPALREKLEKSEKALLIIGSVNLRALETYDAIKQEYEKIAEKANALEKERDEILKIIEEIDLKKKKTFMKTFNAINDLFTQNFSHLSSKGKAFLEIENKEDIFAGGINIIIRVGKGKYFDVTSLSGGEQTLVALSLIFAIQEFHPYSFYILDEIDAALDKRNSELLAALLHKYMKAGQYIVISHNDSIISGANVLYGTSMNNGVSKVLSLKLEEIG